MHSKSVINGLSDWHSIVMTMFWKTVTKLPPIEIKYRSFKNFNEVSFKADLKQRIDSIDFSLEPDFEHFSQIFDNVTEK